MRIVEKRPYEVEFVCAGCSSRLQADAEDVVKGLFGVHDDFDVKYYVPCPICGTKYFIKEKELPPNVIELANSKHRR